MKALGEPDYPGQTLLLRVLDELGAPALETARPVLLTWLDTPMGIEAAKRLQRLDGTASPRMIDIFTRALNSSNTWQRLEGAEGLAQCDPASRALAEPVLGELLAHEYEQIRARADGALARLRSKR